MSLAARILLVGAKILWFFNVPWQFNVQAQRWAFDILSWFMPRRKNTKFEKEDVGDIHGEWIVPDGAGNDKVLYYLHGGAYAICSIRTHRRLISNLAHATQRKAFAIDYALAPEHPFPHALNQSVLCYQRLLEKGYKPENIIISGDSAGGGLAVATMLKLRESGIPLPGMAVLLSPWIDLEGNGESNITADQHNPINNVMLRYFGKLYTGANDIRNPMISPIYGDYKGLPPMLIQTSTAELIFDDSRRLAAKALEADVDVTLEEWNGLLHVWQLWDYILPEARAAIKKIGQFAEERGKLVKPSMHTVAESGE